MLEEDRATRTDDERISPLLLEVAELIARGNTDTQMATHLAIAKSGVKSRVDKLLTVTGAPSRTAAVVRVIESGAIETPQGHVAVRVDHMKALMAALHRAEMINGCMFLLPLRQNFERRYPIIAYRQDSPDGTLPAPPKPAPSKGDSA